MAQIRSRAERRTERLFLLRNNLIEDAKQPDSPGGTDITGREWARISAVNQEVEEAKKDNKISAAKVALERLDPESPYLHRVVRAVFGSGFDDPEAA